MAEREDVPLCSDCSLTFCDFIKVRLDSLPKILRDTLCTVMRVL